MAFATVAQTPRQPAARRQARALGRTIAARANLFRVATRPKMGRGANMQEPTPVSASLEDYDRSVASLVAAFICDPFIGWMFPDSKQYLHYSPLVLKYFAGRTFEHSAAYQSGDFKAAAMWLPPGVSPDEEALGAVLCEGASPELQEEVFGVLEQVGAGHPQVRHWYLPAIGVESPSQGRGYRSTLLAHGLKVCDRDHVAAYLEPTNPANIPLHNRFGYEVRGEIQAGDSPRPVAHAQC
jgi:ribosomal protein S18 acetylase RimI-like enzyme